MQLQEKLKNLPSSPGIYLMKDSLGTIIYVGKAKNLKNRVRSYFQNSKAHSPKVKMLVHNLKDFDLILTDTEFEAFMLECEFIQELKPIYNKKMKSPLSYTYITIQTNADLRRIEVMDRPMEHDSNLTFGPYTSRKTVERAIRGIKESFQIMCSSSYPANSACLNHSIGLCLGMCEGGSAVEEYNRIIDLFIALLNRIDISLLEEMQRRMSAASEQFDFEVAAKYRDYIDAIKAVIHKEKVIEFTEANNNIAVIEYLDDTTIKLFLIKKNKILFREIYVLANFEFQLLREKIRTAILEYFRKDQNHFPTEVNKFEIDEAQIIYSYLNSSSCRYIRFPQETIASGRTDCLDLLLDRLFGEGYAHLP